MTQELFETLGFKVNREKSVLQPSKQLEHLGFVISTELMTISLTSERKKDILDTAAFGQILCSY